MKKKGKYILVAEDDPFIGKIMESTLTENGYRVDRVTDGAQTLNKMETNEYDLVLLDLIMPVKDGFEVLSQLKKANNNTPVVVFSNLAQEEDKNEVLSLGAKGYYVKSSMAMNKLVEVVHTFTK